MKYTDLNWFLLSSIQRICKQILKLIYNLSGRCSEYVTLSVSSLGVWFINVDSRYLFVVIVIVVDLQQ